MRQHLTLPSHDACETLTTTVADVTLQTHPSAKHKRYGSGSALWYPGDLPDRVFRLDSGRIHILSVTTDGEEHLSRVVEPGEVFGEMCFCAHRHEPHGTTARSIGRSDVWTTTYNGFRNTISQDAMLLESVIQTFCTRVSDSEMRQRILANRDARTRLAHLLIHFAQKRIPGELVGDKPVALTMTHADLAAGAALSRPHVSIIMTEFRDRGLVSYGRTTPLLVHLQFLRRAYP